MSRRRLLAAAPAAWLALPACGEPADDAPPDSVGRWAIVGGVADPDTASVVSVRWGVEERDLLCSAVLIEPRRALTAAHCVYGYPVDGLAVGVGDDGDEPDWEIDATGLILHPDWGVGALADLAWIELAEDAPAPPVPASTRDLSGLLGAEVTLVGFGRTSGVADDAGPRRSVVVPIAELAPDRFRWSQPGAGICDGDSGGAAFADLGGGPELVGLLVEGAPDCAGWGAALRLDAWADFLVGPPEGDDDDDDLALPDDDDDAPAPGCGGGAASLLLSCLRRPQRPRPRRAGGPAPRP